MPKKEEMIMLNLFRKKKAFFEINAPIGGECIELENVSDTVFSRKMVGEGFAVIPDKESDTVLSPIDGTITMLPPSKHAIGIKAKYLDVELLVHIGIDTVELAGEGFEALVKEGDEVQAGTPLIKLDRLTMGKKEYDLTTMVIFISGYANEVSIGDLSNTHVSEGQVLLRN